MGTKTKHAIQPTRSENFAEWYQQVVSRAELGEIAHVRGCMVIKPWGMGIWEAIRNALDEQIRARDVENVYFPLFIPLKYIQKEADHVEGFAKEMAVVTHTRLRKIDGELVPDPDAKLAEPVIVRPTSETIFGASMHDWISSYRDLPLKLNQWANVVRWEMKPRVFLRTTEFLWQEGHTAHATEADAMDETLQMHEVYRQFSIEWLAIPVIPGEKPASERFPGAERSFTIEAIMQNGRAVQAGTSHFLGQNFAKAAEIQFDDRNGEVAHAWTTSWGVSTRLVGALIMVHGDDDGLRVPPNVAPKHVVLQPVLRGIPEDQEVLSRCREIAAKLNGLRFGPSVALRCHVDGRDRRSVDKKWEWVRKGVPVRIEIGPRDLDLGAVEVIRRTHLNEPMPVALIDLADRLPRILEEIQGQLLAEATANLEANITYGLGDSAVLAAHFAKPNAGFAVVSWCQSTKCQEELSSWKTSLRCIPFERADEPGPCAICGSPGETVVVGRSY